MRKRFTTMFALVETAIFELEWVFGMNWELVDEQYHFGEHPHHGNVMFVVQSYQHSKTQQQREHIAAVLPLQ